MKKGFTRTIFATQNLRGFTFIELLIVIILLGVLAAGIIVTLNPRALLYQRTDTQVKQDVTQIANAMQTYFAARQYYPSAIVDLVSVGAIKTVPAPPLWYAPYTIAALPDGCITADQNCTAVAIGGQIKAPAQSGNTVWCWQSNTAAAAESPTCTP